jgi:acyl-CoA reductase-like NAD-dependent aldehyde dehydrogenase
MASLPESNGNSVSVPMWINGKEESGAITFDIISPATNAPCWNAAAATAADARRAVESAEKASATWSTSKPTWRMEILLRTAANLEKNSVEFAGYMATEMGVDMPVAQFFMLPLAISMLKDIAARTSSICGSVPHCQQNGQSAIVFKEPYGVTLGIVPWSVYTSTATDK